MIFKAALDEQMERIRIKLERMKAGGFHLPLRGESSSTATTLSEEWEGRESVSSVGRLSASQPRPRSVSASSRRRAKRRRRSVERSRSKRVANYVRKAGQAQLRKIQEDEPLWVKISKDVYHRYGLKHLVLVLILLLYALLGAVVFVMIEEPEQQRVKTEWSTGLALNRSVFVGRVMGELFNNSDFLVFVPFRTGVRIRHRIQELFAVYEGQLGLKYTEQKIEWDFWNAILYCGTIFTTIGYGHIYPRTAAGRIITMVYSIGGIPLVLLVLQDLGRLLTVGLKFPWFQSKRGFRRMLRYVTKQSWEEMMEIEAKERLELEVFDLPIPVAIVIVVGWIFLCSATFCIWETDWTYLEAFYFFFISLSTVGLGDLTPTNPRLLLMMFGYIIIGLSLVSMVINLIQMKLERTYQVGQAKEGGPGLAKTRKRASKAPPPVEGPGEGPGEGGEGGPSTIAGLGIFQSIPSLTDTVLMGSGCHGYLSRGSLTPRRVHRSTQTRECRPEGRGRTESADDISHLVALTDAEVRVLSDVGELYEEEVELALPENSPETPPGPPIGPSAPSLLTAGSALLSLPFAQPRPVTFFQSLE